MATDEFFSARPQTMSDLLHTLALLTARPPRHGIEAALAFKFARDDRAPNSATIDGLFGVEAVESGGGISSAGRRRAPTGLIAGLLYLQNSRRRAH